MTEVYRDGFETWQDVCREFSMEEPEPDEVIVAEYDLSQAYEGNSRVLYRRGERFYLVEGGHCSCYGLEGQWEPTEYESREELLGVIEKCYDKAWWAPVIESLRPST